MSLDGIRLHDVGLRRDGRDLLISVSADLPRGSATAVVGPSGAGKSTLLALIAGFEQPDTGSVENPFPLARTGVVLQAYGLIRLLTAAENVELALQTHHLPRAEIRDRATEQLHRFGLAGLADHRTDELSGGQQQRLAIARALVIRPDLLIADELTSELDPRNRDRTLQEILGLREHGVTIVLATHDLDIAAHCDTQVEVGRADPLDASRSKTERSRTTAHALQEQRRRITAQQEIVHREQARLHDLQQALQRLEHDRDGQEAD